MAEPLQKGQIKTPFTTTNGGEALQILPPQTPLKVTRDESITATTEITLQTGTSLLFITAQIDDVFVRFGTDDASIATDGFHFVVPAGSSLPLAVPDGITAINVIGASSASIVNITEL
jgi:hypothetical protein